MTKRVVLIGHPVAHSLSGAMQQAAFDALGIDAAYELWDKAPIELADAIGELRGDDFLGANVTIPHKERVVPLVDRMTEEAQATGAVNTITREGKRLVGHNTDVPGLQGRARQARRQAEDAAAGRRARRRRRRSRGRPRPDHGGIPADHRVQPAPPPGRGAGQALRPECRPHGAAGDALARVDHRGRAGQDQGPDQRDVDRPDERREPDPGRGPPRGPAGPRPHLRPDPAPARRRKRPAPPSRTASRCCSTRAPPRSRCGPARRPRSTSWARPGGRPGRRLRSAEGEPTGEPVPADAAAEPVPASRADAAPARTHETVAMARLPLPDRRGVARPGARA